MPASDAGIGLPDERLDAAGPAALDVPDQALALFGVQPLGVHHGVVAAVVPFETRIVEVGGDAQPQLLVHAAERQSAVVEVDQVRLVRVNHVERAVVELLGVGDARLVAGPVLLRFLIRGVRTGPVVLGVKVLRIETVPPLAVAVGLGELAVVRDARLGSRLVAQLRDFIPAPRPRGMQADAEPQALRPSSFCPHADEVLLRADRRGVPRLVLRVPVVEVAMMVSHRHEVLRPRLFVKRDEFLAGRTLRPSRHGKRP